MSTILEMVEENSIKIRIDSYFKGNGFCGDSENKKIIMEIFKDILNFEHCFHVPPSQRKNPNQMKGFLKLNQSK